MSEHLQPDSEHWQLISEHLQPDSEHLQPVSGQVEPICQHVERLTSIPPGETIVKILKLIGEQIILARKRRMLSQEQFARELGMSRSTLRVIESGAPGTALSTYIRIFLLMGKHLELIQFASTDLYGKKLQDERMLARKHKIPEPDPNQY